MRQQLSQPQEGSSEPQPVDELALYLQAAGGVQKKRVFGLGSSCSSYYGGGASSSSSQNNPRNDELEQRVENLQEELRTMREETTQREAEMRRRDEESRDMQRQLRAQRHFQEQMMAYMQSQPGGWNINPAPPQDDEDDNEDDGLDGAHGDWELL